MSAFNRVAENHYVLDVPGGELAEELKPLEAVTLTELLVHKFPDREFILKPVLTLGSLTMIYSWRGVGKTHVSLGIAYAAASGGSFWNWKAERAFRVLYIDGEMPGEALQARVAAIVQASDEDPDPDYFRVLTIDLQGGFMPDLATRKGQAVIARECDRAELIVVDNLSCLVRGKGRENEAESWVLAAEWALSMRSKGKAVVFVHHAGKDGNQRGTSKREDLLDLSISLKRPPDYEIGQGARFEVRFEKARHLTGADAAPFEAWLQSDEQGGQIWTRKPISEATMERVADLANLGMNQRDIAEELGLHKSTVSRAHRKATKEGLIKNTQKGKRRADDH
ncbi:MAG: AAA family ATPase [Pseudomonadota bacterium]